MIPPISDPHSPQENSVEKQASPQSSARGARWGWGMILLWVYSLLIMALAAIGSFIAPIAPPSPEQAAQDAILGGIALMPVVFFIVLVGIQNFKR